MVLIRKQEMLKIHVLDCRKLKLFTKLSAKIFKNSLKFCQNSIFRQLQLLPRPQLSPKKRPVLHTPQFRNKKKLMHFKEPSTNERVGQSLKLTCAARGPLTVFASLLQDLQFKAPLFSARLDPITFRG